MLKQTTVYQNPDINVAVDEAMTQFTGQSNNTLTILCKSTATGIKI